MRWSLIFALIGVVLWSQPGIGAKIDRFTDQEGTLHISNESQAEPGKPGVQAPAPLGTSLPQIFPPARPPALVPPPEAMPSPTEPPESNQAEPPAPENGGEAHPAPTAPPARVVPGQKQ